MIICGNNIILSILYLGMIFFIGNFRRLADFSVREKSKKYLLNTAKQLRALPYISAGGVSCLCSRASTPSLTIGMPYRFFIVSPKINSKMDKHLIGENAGILWRLLSTDPQRRWEFSEIISITGFDAVELACAIGWLAREDKIQLELEHHKSKDKKGCLYLILNVYI